MRKSKKAQLTLFIIVGIIMIIGISSLFMFLSKPSSKIQTIKSNDALGSLKINIEDCLKENSINAINYFGLDIPKINSYLSTFLPDCIDPYIEEINKKYTVSAELKNINLDLRTESFLITLDYPVEISKEEEEIIFDKFSYTIPLKTEVALSTDLDCKLDFDSSLFSFNRKFKVAIPKGTVVKDKEGNCLTKLTLNVKDTLNYTGDMSNSIGPLTYLIGPSGAEFSDFINIEFNYSQLDYDNYIASSVEENKFFELEKNLKIKYYDLETKDYYIYSSINDYWIGGRSNEGVIKARTKIIYGENLSTDSSCKLKSDILIQSENNRVDLLIPEGTILKKSNGECLDKVDIKIEPRRSNVVTFGDHEYIFEPHGTTFSKDITYVYNYNLADISDPRFLYGGNNWQDLIIQNWTIPEYKYDANRIRIDGIKERVPGELSIAYYDKEDGIYVPWNTYVDTKNKRVIADIEHFSQIVPAQGCNDQRYFKIKDLLTIPYNSQGNCTKGLKEEIEIRLKPVFGDSCTKKEGGLMSLAQYGSLMDSVELSSENASVVSVSLTELWGSKSDRNNCAYVDLYMNIKGIGIESNLEKEWMEISKGEYAGTGRIEVKLNISDSFEAGGTTGENGCDKSLEAGCIEKDLCRRCWNDMFHEGKKCSEISSGGGWDCSVSRLNNCVRSNCMGGGEEEEELSGLEEESLISKENTLNIDSNNFAIWNSSCEIFPSESWKTSSPSSLGLDESKLAQIKNNVGGRGAIYYKGVKVYSWGDNSKRGDIASASKPILSLILFYSIDKGKIPSVNTKISDYMGSCAGGATFYHVANMISGYALGESDGVKWAYNDRAIALYGNTLFGKVWKSSAQNVFNSVFSPLKFQNSPQMDSGAKSGRLSISIDDLAKIGLLVSCKGNWDGNQIISEESFNLIKNQVPSSLSRSSKGKSCSSDPCKIGSFGGSCNQNANGQGRYGYNFWVFNEAYSKGGIQVPQDTLMFDGHWGKEVMIIIPSREIIAVGFGSWGAAADDSSKGVRKNIKLLVDAVPNNN